MMTTNLKVLYIEDSDIDAQLFKKHFLNKIEGPLEYIHVTTLEQGLTELARTVFDVIFLDLSLPDAVGMEGITRIYEKNQSVPIIVLTGDNDRLMAIEAVRKGAQDYLMKDELSLNIVWKSIHYAIEQNQINQRYNKIFMNSYDAIFLHEYNKEGKIVDSNNQACQLLGYGREEMMELPFFDLFVNKNKFDWENKFIPQEKMGKVVFEIETKKKDGSLFLASVSSGLIKIKDRLYIQSILRDITVIHKAHQEIINQKLMLSTVLDIIGEGLIVVDKNYNVMLWNQMSKKIFGPSLSIKDLSIWSLLIDCYLLDKVTRCPRDEIPLVKALRGEIVTGTELYIKNIHHPQGLFVICTASPIMDSAGNILSALITFRDISFLKRAEEEAILSSRLKTEFLTNMSHEIRTPLNVISGIAEILKEKIHEEEPAHYMGILQTSVESLLSLINNIIDISKIESGKMKVENIEFSWMNVIEDISEIIAPLVHKKDLEFKVYVKDEFTDHSMGDPYKIRQFLLNLISNAVKFTQQGNVSLNLRPDENDSEQMVIEISDTGIGIEKNKLSTIFEKFSQTDTSNTRKFGGSGLGLSISKKLIELINGHIEIKSEFGKGTTFKITLPTNRMGQSNFKKAYKFEGLDLTNIKAVIIDKDIAERETLEKFLKYNNASYVSYEHFNKSTSAKDSATFDATVKTIKEMVQDKSLNLLFFNIKTSGLENAEYLIKECGVNPEHIIMIMPPINRNDDIEKIKKMSIKGIIYHPLKKKYLELTLIKVLKKGDGKILLDITEENIQLQGRVLLAEDFPDNAVVIKKFLERHEIELDMAADGVEAIEKFKNKKYDVVLMDIQMPHKDGLQATQEIRKWEADEGREKTSIVALTANASQNDLEICFKVGMNNYLTKPIKKRKLEETLMIYINKKTAPKNNENKENKENKEKEEKTKMEKYNFHNDTPNPDLQECIPDYINNRWEDLSTMKEAMKKNDFLAVNKICHKILGSAQTYGLGSFHVLTEHLHTHSKEKDMNSVKESLNEFEDYLNSAKN